MALKMTDEELYRALRKLRAESRQLITVSNREWYSLFRDEIRNSIAIEGVFANRNELLDVLERHKRTNTQKTAAILGYFEAASTLYEYANNLYKTGEFSLRVSDIKQIHTLLMRYEKDIGTFTGELGEFRKEDVGVTESGFTPLKGIFVEETMRVFVQWINNQLTASSTDPIDLAAASHVLFETIHPFRDGNGRVGRILMNFLLIGMGLINIAIKGTTREHRNAYYQALEVGDDKFNEMLRKIETGTKPTIALIEHYANVSHLERMKKLIRDELQEAFQRLKGRTGIAFQPDALLPLREIARYYNYSQDYLRNLINKGKLRGEKRGKLWYIRIRDMEQYLQKMNSEQSNTTGNNGN